MSNEAKTLLYWAELSRPTVADDEDYKECAKNAREWAAIIIGGAY